MLIFSSDFVVFSHYISHYIAKIGHIKNSLPSVSKLLWQSRHEIVLVFSCDVYPSEMACQMRENQHIDCPSVIDWIVVFFWITSMSCDWEVAGGDELLSNPHVIREEMTLGELMFSIKVHAGTTIDVHRYIIYNKHCDKH